MGKFKKGLSDKVRGKLKGKGHSVPINPFEVKVNKVKHTVVNKKVEKWEKGLPGVSRSKAIKKRKDTILNELQQMKKSNSLHDRRIGEKDENLTPEEKMVQRFAMERKIKSDKQSIFNLNEEEVVLTHYGQSLAENLKDKPGSDSEDEDDYRQRDKDTGKFQFGGFAGDQSSWKDKMDEIVAESKKQKYERQMEKEKSYEATQELDGLWKSVITKMAPRKDQPTRQMSAFTLLSRSLIMEQKSEGAADKIKSEEEKAREEADKLKKLEAQRLERMVDKKRVSVSDHISADSLDCGYAVDKKGKLKVSFADDDSSEESGSEGEDDVVDQDENGEEDEEEDSSDEDEDADSYSDLNDDEDVSDSDVEETEQASNGKEDKKASKSILKNSKIPPLKSREGSAQSDLPFIFDAPTAYEQLRILLHGHTTTDQLTTLSRLRKCHHPSLAEENKTKLENIHLFVLEYYGAVVLEENVDAKLVDGLSTQIWEMTQTFPNATAKFLQNIVLERQKEYMSILEKRGGRGVFPSLDTLAYLRLVEIIFSVSDFRHRVATPSMLFMAQLLYESSVKTLKDIMSGLYLCSLCLQYVHYSKRYVPEVITFLHGVLSLASKDTDKSPNFPPIKKQTCLLALSEKCHSVSPHVSLSAVLNSDLAELDTNQLKCDLLNVCIDLLCEAITIWEELPCLLLVMKPISQQLKLLPKNLYPTKVKETLQSLASRIEDTKKLKFSVMQHESKRPEPLPLFEPKLQENWSGKRKKGGSSKETNERQRLLHKYKREMKSAVREIKRDNAVVAKHKLDLTLQKDAERKRKVQEIMGSLASQEGDYKAIKRGKSD